MKPLAIVTTYNRLAETKRCLASFEPSLDSLEMVIVDNGSTDDMTEFLHVFAETHPTARVIFMGHNAGCPRALNEALQLRRPGQAVIKIDNDVVLSHSDVQWLSDVKALVSELDELGNSVAMVSAYYEPWDQNRVTGARSQWRGEKLLSVCPVIGHCVYHAGAFMDAVGFFDVLAPEHIYGFEDLTMSHKATALNLAMVAWGGWRIENIQRHGAMPRSERDEHVEAMRPLYNSRAARISRNRVYTNAKGELE